MSISVNRALTELKLVTKRIEQKRSGLNICATVKKDHEEKSVKEFVTKSNSLIQQMKDLIERRNQLKSAIVQSNAATYVTVAQSHMSVAEAIERKTSIEIEKTFLKEVRQRYFTAKDSTDRHNQTIAGRANDHALAALTSDGEVSEKSEVYKTIVNSYKNENELVLLAPDDIEEWIEKTQDQIDEFESEVDFVLSESNTVTLLVV